MSARFQEIIDAGGLDIVGLDIQPNSFKTAGESLIVCGIGEEVEYSTFTCRKCMVQQSFQYRSSIDIMLAHRFTLYDPRNTGVKVGSQHVNYISPVFSSYKHYAICFRRQVRVQLEACTTKYLTTAHIVRLALIRTTQAPSNAPPVLTAHPPNTQHPRQYLTA